MSIYLYLPFSHTRPQGYRICRDMQNGFLALKIYTYDFDHDNTIRSNLIEYWIRY